MSVNKNGTAYFLIYDESIKNLGVGEDCEFNNWLKAEGFTRVVEPIGNHAITIEEFKAIYEVYKKYEGKQVLEF